MSDEIKKPTVVDVPPDSLWSKMPIIGAVCAVVGLGGTLAAAASEATRARAMFSYLFAFEVCLAIALGALGWLLIELTVRAGWSVVIRRLTDTAMGTLPLFALLWIPIGTLGFHDLYPWTHETDKVLMAKRWFLNPNFFYLRAVIYFAIWIALSRVLYRLSIRNDTEGVDRSRRDQLVQKMWSVAAPGILLWALSQSFAAVDWLMSLDAHWYSTIYGVYYFAGSILAFFSFATLVTMSLQQSGLIKEATPEHFHDLGKYIFGWVIFWAYIAFSQFMLIWYANMPEETEFFLVRIHGGWQYLSYALPVIHFFFPFLFLLSRHVKRNRKALAFGAAWMLLMEVVDIYWLVMPNFGAHGEGAPPAMSIAWTDLAALVGMFGAFIAAFSWLLTRNKVVAVNDPRLVESLIHENY